jgi:predicted dehydrogenase
VSSKLQVALVGCGHMGRHHARVIAAHAGCELVAVVDTHADRAVELAVRHGTAARDVVPEGVDAVVIATPTVSHPGIAAPLVAAGAWCLVEKPLSVSAAAASGLAGPRVVVGHVERFNPAIRALRGYRPRGIDARRMGPPTGRALDVDVVFDLMIHDLDLLLSWGGDVVEVEASGEFGGGRVEHAVARLITADGTVARLEASRIAPAVDRRMILDDGMIELDLVRGVAVREGVEVSRIDRMDALEAQWDAFVRAVRGEVGVVVGFSDGLRAVALAERISGLIAKA